MHSFLPEKRASSRHIKGILIFGCLIFAIFSASIPAFQVLHTRELQKTQVLSVSQTKTEIVVNKESSTASDDAIRETQYRALKREKRRISPTPTPRPEKEKAVNKEESSPEQESDTEDQSAPTGSSSQQQLFQALNNYRQKKGKSVLSWDGKLASFAQGRAEQFARDNKMDSHAGFKVMFDNDGHRQMGFLKMGENSSMSDNTDYTYIIESLYAGSVGHEENQLNTEYTHVGVGVSGKYTNLVFGGKKL